MNLTIKQKKFADEYIISGNIYQSLILAGYSVNYAKSDGCKILENPRVKDYIEARLKKLDDEKIADQKEILMYLTSVMRGEQTEQTLKSAGSDFGQDIVDIEVGAKDRIKAAELLGKRYGTWTDRMDIDTDMSIKIEVDYGED